MKAILTACAAAAGLLAPSLAAACGGFFCSASPVDQQAERIIFVQKDTTTVESYVEILYQGAPEDFAWVVPVPAVPELDVWNGAAFNALDLATQPQFEIPWGCFAPEAADADAGGGRAPGEDDVQVLAQERVGPFDTATITSDDPRALVDWLRRNGYRIVPAMEPFIALYTREQLKFLAMKLAPGEDTAAIQPIKMTYRASGPSVPLRLTAVAAQLEMGVKVWILADRRYGPLNVFPVEIDDADLRFDPWTWQTNYTALVARAVDAVGGHGFVTELAQPTAPLAQTIRESFVPDWAGEEAVQARDQLAELIASKPYITRLYTRVSPEEMDVDPIFGPVEGGDVSNRRIVPMPEEQDQCNWGGPAEAADDACAFAACGAGGRCAAVEDANLGATVGCACADGTVARAAVDSTTRGGVTVSCGDARLNFTDPTALDPNDPLAFADPCQGNPCGANGHCLSLNGFQSCLCDAGYVAVGRIDPEGMAFATCAAPIEPITVVDITLREPNLPYPGRPETRPVSPNPMTPVMPGDEAPQPRMISGAAPGNDGGCQAGPGRPAHFAWLLLAPLGLLLRRRRR